jgi:acetolactate synthase-1/2/3 large subunit
MQSHGAEITIRLLERQGVRVLAGIPGGASLPLYDALRGSRIRHVLARHEQGAGFIAQGLARTTGRAAVCLGTSGPGATNLLTAIADARLDSVPLVAITGQVPSAMIGTDAFQEVDTYGLTVPITKHNFALRDARELLEVVPLAFEIAESGRPGPVLIDIPKDVQTQEIEVEAWPEPGRAAAPAAPCAARVTELVAMIRAAKRPVLYIGGGAMRADTSADLVRLARRQSIPVASTLMGLGAFPADDPLFLGMLGMHGARYTNRLLDEADLLLAFGVRFDDRATGKASAFCPRARIAHVDIDPAEIDKIKPTQLSIAADLGGVMRELLPQLESDARPAWRARVAELKRSEPLILPAAEDACHPLNLIRGLERQLPRDAILTTDVGQHQMWVAQVYPFRRPRTLLTSGGLGTMGFGLPAAIGAALARPHTRVVCISGDGSLLMNLQELATLAELDLDVTVILLDNQHLGLVRQQQELFYGSRFSAARLEGKTDFPAIARGFGIPGHALGDAVEPLAVLEHALREPGPHLVHVPVDPTEKVFPMVPPGAANTEMIEKEAARA